MVLLLLVPAYRGCPGKTHTHNRFTAILDFVQDYPGEPVPERQNQSGFTGARDGELQWHLLAHMQICTSPQITTPTFYHSVFTGRMPFLPPNQQHQSTEGDCPGKEVVKRM